MKLLFVLTYIVTGMFTVLISVSDSFWTNLPMTIIALGTFIVTAGGFFWKIMSEIRANRRISDAKFTAIDSTTKDTNEKMQGIAKSIDGLLEQKTLADTALGKLKGIEEAAKEKAIGDNRELEVRKQQDLLHQTPPNSNQSNSDIRVSEAKDQIVHTIETEIKKQGDKIQDAVKDKGDEIKTEVPEKTADKVLEKIKPEENKPPQT